MGQDSKWEIAHLSQPQLQASLQLQAQIAKGIEHIHHSLLFKARHWPLHTEIPRENNMQLVLL